MIAIALNKPSTKAIFFNNFSVFMETSEGNKNLKIEDLKLKLFDKVFNHFTNKENLD